MHPKAVVFREPQDKSSCAELMFPAGEEHEVAALVSTISLFFPKSWPRRGIFAPGDYSGDICGHR